MTPQMKAEIQHRAKQAGMTEIARGGGDGVCHSGAEQETNSGNDGRRDEVCGPGQENPAG